MSLPPAFVPPTPAQYQQLILAEVGVVFEPDGSPVIPVTGPGTTGQTAELVSAFTLVIAMIGTIWSIYNTQGQQSLRLQYLYTKQQALDILTGGTWQDVDYEESGVKESLTDVFKALWTMRMQTAADIAVIQGQLNAGGGPALAALVTVAPVPSPPCAPDPSSGYYRGIPYMLPQGNFLAASDGFPDTTDPDVFPSNPYAALGEGTGR